MTEETERMIEEHEADYRAALVDDGTGRDRKVFDQNVFNKLRQERQYAKALKVSRARFDEMTETERWQHVRAGGIVTD